MSGATEPADAAAKLQVGTTKTEGLVDALRKRIERLGATVTILAGIGGALAAGLATAGGYVTAGYDWLTSTSQTQSQVTAIDERLKVLEGDKAGLVKDREEMARLARDLDRVTSDLGRAGVDVRAVQDLQRRLEMRVERMDAILDMLRERRS